MGILVHTYATELVLGGCIEHLMAMYVYGFSDETVSVLEV